MGCCDHENAGPGIAIDYGQLPEQTFCCMARVMYTTAVAADEYLCGKKHPAWSDLNERQRVELAFDAKRALTQQYEGDTPLSRLMVVLVRSMTSAT